MKTSTTRKQKTDGSRISWLLTEFLADEPREPVNVEKIQEKELEAKVGTQLNLWLEWIIAKEDIL